MQPTLSIRNHRRGLCTHIISRLLRQNMPLHRKARLESQYEDKSEAQQKFQYSKLMEEMIELKRILKPPQACCANLNGEVVEGLSRSK